MKDPYKVLGIQSGASQKEIQQAYRQLALQYHPDRNPNDHNAAEMFKMITDAYQTLSARPESSYANPSHSASQSDVKWVKPDEMPVPHDSEWAEIWQGTPPPFSISPLMKKTLWVDAFLAGILFFIFLAFGDSLPNEHVPVHVPLKYGGGRNWADRLGGGIIIQCVLSIYALYKLYRRAPSHFLSYYGIGKCIVLLSLITGCVGISTTEHSMFWPFVVVLWNAAVLIYVFLYRLDQDFARG